MNEHDLRRLLEGMGREAPPPPDVDFVDQLEFQLRAEVIASSPSPAWAGAPWRIPFGIAAAAFTVVVGIAGVSVLVDLPDSQVSAQLASVSGHAEVIMPSGKSYEGRPGMTIPEGSVVRVLEGSTAIVDGVPLDAGQAVKVTDAGLLHVDFENPLDSPDGDDAEQLVAPSNDGRGAAGENFDLETTIRTGGNSATPPTSAGLPRDVQRVSPSPLDPGTIRGGTKSTTTKNPLGPPRSTTSVAPIAQAPPEVVPLLLPSTAPTFPAPEISVPLETVPPSTDTTTSTTAEPPATTETTVPPAAVGEEPPPPGGTTTTTEPDTEPAGGTDPGGDPGGTVEPAGSTGGDQQAIDDGLDPAGDADQTAAGDTGTAAADDAGAQDDGDAGGQGDRIDDPAGETTDATVEV